MEQTGAILAIKYPGFLRELMLAFWVKNVRRYFKKRLYIYIFLFCQGIRICYSMQILFPMQTTCMTYRILFSGENNHQFVVCRNCPESGKG